MTDSPEKILFDFLTESKAADPLGVINEFDLKATVYKFADQCIRIGNCESEFSPSRGGEIDEFNADTHVQILAKVADVDLESSWVDARESARAAGIETVKFIFDDPTLGDRRCSATILRGFRGWSRVQTAYYATVIIPLRIQPI